MKSPSQIADSESGQHTAEVPYRVHFYENCSQSPASWLVPQALGEIEENGFAGRSPALPIYEEPCVAAIGADGKAMALITYVYVSGICHITLGYTRPIIDGKVSIPLFSMPLLRESQNEETSFQSPPVRTPKTWPPKQHSKRKVGPKNSSNIPFA